MSEVISLIALYWLKGTGLGLGLYTVILASQLAGELPALLARSF